MISCSSRLLPDNNIGASGKILAGLVTLTVGAIIGVVVFPWNPVEGPSDRPRYQLVFDYAYLNQPVSVSNARWEIGLIIRNGGNTEVLLRNVYVGEKLILERGLLQVIAYRASLLLVAASQATD